MGTQSGHARTAFILPFSAKKRPDRDDGAARERENLNLYDPCRAPAGYGNDGECLGAPTHMIFRRCASRACRRRR